MTEKAIVFSPKEKSLSILPANFEKVYIIININLAYGRKV
jgi:hypothetical protein